MNAHQHYSTRFSVYKPILPKRIRFSRVKGQTNSVSHFLQALHCCLSLILALAEVQGDERDEDVQERHGRITLAKQLCALVAAFIENLAQMGRDGGVKRRLNEGKQRKEPRSRRLRDGVRLKPLYVVREKFENAFL